ncbi:MAG: CHASE2 domain-containing protein, partial [Burkholderiales bacterium]
PLFYLKHDNACRSRLRLRSPTMKLPAVFRSFLLPAPLLRSGIALVAILLTCWTQWVPAPGEWNFANEWLRDRFIRLHASTSPDPRILVVDIDESSLAEIGAWPWPRTRIAALLETLLSNYSARGIALDIVLPEHADGEGDARLAKLAQYGPVVLAQAFDYAVQPLPLRIGSITGGDPALAQTANLTAPTATGYIANHAGLAHAAHIGNIGFIPDQDGALRRLPMVTQFDGQGYPTLALALFACCAGGNVNQVLSSNGSRNAGLFRVPLERKWSAYKGESAANILNLRSPANEIAGRLVLVGSSALGLTDRVATPLAASTPGLLVHAALLSSLLDRQQGRAPKMWPGRWIAVLFSIAATVMATYIFAHLSAVSSVALLGAASLVWLALAYWIYPHDPTFSTTGPLVSNLFLLAVAVPFDWQISQRKSRRLLGTLRQYVAREVVDELLLSNLKNPLAPRQLSVTTLIADMERYTSHVESLPVEEAAEITRDFLDCLTRPVLEQHGTLDKYTGDGLVAFWGAPLPNDNHADLALDAAKAIVREVHRFNQSRSAAGKIPVRVRIGIESGVAMAGDFGTSFRSIYTAVGDSVNVASRLEESAREFPHDIIIGPGAVSQAKRHRFIALGERILRGKEKPTALYTLEPGA